MTVGERIKNRRESLGLTQENLAELIGVKGKSSISKIENAGNEVSLKTIRKASVALRCSPGFLMGWMESEKPSIQYAPKDAIDKTQDYIDTIYKVNVLGRVAAGIPIEMSEDIIGEENITQELAHKGELFGLKISGNSMEPEIHDGDVVIVKQQEDVESGEIAIVTINGDDATCKRLIKYADGISLVSINPTYAPMYFSDQECQEKPIRIIGKVMETRHKYY